MKDWSPRQKLLLGEMHGSLIATRERRQRLRRMMALEIEETPDFLRLYKLAGLNLVTTEAAAPGTSGGRSQGEHALVAIIGDIQRFATSKKLVSYLGLNPSVVESGNFEGGGALHQHGRGSLRALLIQASKRLLTTVNPLQKWGLRCSRWRLLKKALTDSFTGDVRKRLTTPSSATAEGGALAAGEGGWGQDGRRRRDGRQQPA